MSSAATEVPESEGADGGRWSGAWRVAVALALPLVIVGNSVLLLLIPWHADLQYAVPGFPDPPTRFTGGERSDLARDGIVSIWPVGPGVRILEEARLQTGAPAFGADEVSHMSDVRDVVRALMVAWSISVIVLAIILYRLGLARLNRPLRVGAWLTLGAFLLVGLVSALAFDSVFTYFHEALFEDGTWTFPMDSTLIGLYPERFWITATGALVLLSVLQALSIIWWSGRSRMPR